jgi:hypothetical protein
MGVIKRFAISSMVLGVLAIAGGTSALAFDGSSGQVQGVQRAEQPTQFSEASSDLTSDVPSEVLPDTGGDSDALRWATTRTGPSRN